MKIFSLIALAMLLAGCRYEPSSTATVARDEVVEAIDSPAGPGSSEPFLVSAGDELLLTWQEKRGDETAVLFSKRVGDEWTAPSVVEQRSDLFANWADFPAIAAAADGTLFAHALVKRSSATYAYDIQLRRSFDGGRSWAAPITVHRDGIAAEHGFVSMSPVDRDGVRLVWLDGRKTGGHGHHHGGAMTLRTAVVRSNGSIDDERELDDRVCDCCQTGMTSANGVATIAYRDRSDDEIRDITLLQLGSGGEMARMTIDDGWKIGGCPVNGPQLDRAGDTISLGWFTAAGGTNQVRYAWSKDAGRSWTAPATLDAAGAIGRVEVIAIDSDRSMIFWLNERGDVAELRGARVELGKSVEPFTIARTSSARASGFPRAAKAGDDVYLAWTDPAAKRVRIVRIERKL